MPTGHYRVNVILPYLSGLPEDVAQNTFYFRQSAGGTSHAEDADDIGASMEAFYNDIFSPATDAIAEYIGDQVSRAVGACQVQCYFTDGDSPNVAWGSPVQVRSFTLGVADAGEPLPAEIAICSSIHGDLTNIPESAPATPPATGTIRPAARRRGRIFIGPLQRTATTGSGANGDARPTTAAKLAILHSSLNLADNGPGGMFWEVASKADDVFYLVAGGYVDDACDVQRRRGSAPESREVWLAS